MAIAAAGALLWPSMATADCAGAADHLAQLDCLETTYAKADAELNAIWPDVLASHPSGGMVEQHKADIRAAQRAWIAFRDADCTALMKVGIPKYWRANELRCLIDHTRARTVALSDAYLG
ncbi:MAG: lysozyme inhibitor LprI family protein [Pseudomonadota bacterium]